MPSIYVLPDEAIVISIFDSLAQALGLREADLAIGAEHSKHFPEFSRVFFFETF